MEKLRVYKGNKGLAWFLLVLGGVLMVLGLVLFIIYLINQEETDVSLASMLLYFFQGVMLSVLAYLNLRSSKYYMEWNKELISYYLPGQKRVESIQIGDIEEVDIRLYEIRMRVAGQEKVIDLEQSQFEEIRKIKEKFEMIKP